MVNIGEIERPGRDIVNSFGGLSAADVHEAMGKSNAMAPEIGPISATASLCGPAYTVRVPPGDNLTVHAAAQFSEPNDILVVSTATKRAAIWGELMTLNAQRKGLGGLVTDGNIRDSDWLSDCDFPVFASATSQAGAVKETPGAINIPVSVGDVTVSPGDIVLGDSDGISVIPKDIAPSVLERTKEVMAREKQIRKRIEQGESLYKILELDKKIDRIEDSDPYQSDG